MNYTGGIMRVRISYGIDLADASAKTAQLVQEAISELQEKLDMLHRGIFLLESESLVDAAPAWLDEIRQGMANTDQILADAHAIVAGYVSVKNQQQQPVAPVPPPAPSPASPDPVSSMEEAEDVREG
jgi:hypothetical protein